jgi:hypothetical protein
VEQDIIRMENIGGYSKSAIRVKVPKGWFIYDGNDCMTFVSDPKHEWKLKDQE